MHLPYIAFTFALISMSIFQSRHVSRINLKLEDQLAEIRDLSEKKPGPRTLSSGVRSSARAPGIGIPTEIVRTGKGTQTATLSASGTIRSLASRGNLTRLGFTNQGYNTEPDLDLHTAHGGCLVPGGSTSADNSLDKNANPSLDNLIREMSRRLREIGLRRHYMCFGLLGIENDPVTWYSAGIARSIACLWARHDIPDALQMDNELAFRGSNRYPRCFSVVVRFALALGVSPVFILVKEP